MKGIQYPESKVAKFELFPKQPLQRASPTLQLVIAEPMTGRVAWMKPPVQPSQQPPSRTEKGVNWVAILQKGRTMDLGELMQNRGRERLQGVSPSKGLQLLQETRPAQLLSQEGQRVACMVRPFLMGWMATGVAGVWLCVRASSSRTVRGNWILIYIIISQKNTADKRSQAGITTFIASKGPEVWESQRGLIVWPFF